MTEAIERRKLTAILSADVQGYSRLMGDDEALTVKTLTRYRKLFAGCIQEHGGRVVNAPGDSILAEFPSVVDAVNCAAVVQAQLAAANAGLPDHRRMVFRIGINLGDVIQRGEDIFGDGVNIAARVEALADGGGVCITRPVFDQVKNQLPQFNFRYLGEHTVKNIAEPVRVYRMRGGSVGAPGPDGAGRSVIQGAKPANRSVSIGVMPFEYFSGRRDPDYFSIGFVEDLITDLAHFATLQVISSYTTRGMAEESPDQLAVARQLGIDYLLKGNLRRLKGHLRISTQMIETAGGRILWAERYDAPMETLFEIQDDIVARVVSAISTQIDRSLLAAARKKPFTRMAAYDFWLRGMARLRQGTPAADREAREFFNRALAVDPHYSRAYAGLSLSHFNDWSCQLWERWETTERKAYDYAMQALQLDDTDHVVQMILGRILLFRRQFDLAAHHLDNALALNANDADNLVQIASSLAFLGDAKRGEQLFLKSLKLNPYRESWYYTYGAWPYMILRRYDAFLETALKGPLTEVWVDQPAYIAAAYAFQGDRDQAARYLELFKEVFSKEIFNGRDPSSKEMIAWIHKANPLRREADFEQIREGLILAGLEPPSRTADVDMPVGATKNRQLHANVFRKTEGQWLISFEDLSVRLPEVKGFFDLAVLLERPGLEAHCTQLMGSVLQVDDRELLIDEKARQQYETRIRDLQEAIADAESMNDLGPSEALREELDQLTTHLAKALGLGGRARSVNTPVDRSRSAVTWRIRSAIRKIEAVHPALGRHLNHSIRTGTFCCYAPEKEQVWRI